MEKYYFNNKELSPDKQGRIVNGNLVFPGEVPVYILSDEEYLDCFRLKTYRRINGFPKWIIHRNESSKGTVPAMRLNKFGS